MNEISGTSPAPELSARMFHRTGEGEDSRGRLSPEVSGWSGSRSGGAQRLPAG
ncbi:MAG: hypothetical protein QOI29_5152 [Mycobacterium sp.]|jgi:hypothetical protein|nr:hypothetical protein [Mycobacterium sp.]